MIKPGMRVVRDDGLRAKFIRRLSCGYGVFCYDGDNTPERVSRIDDFAIEGACDDAAAKGGETLS